jgi:hypothetical protein
MPSSSSASTKVSTACVLTAWGIALAWILFIGVVCVRAVLKDLPEREDKRKKRLMIMRRERASTGSDMTLVGGSRISRASDTTLLGSTAHSGLLPTPPAATLKSRESRDSVETTYEYQQEVTPRVSQFLYTPVMGGGDWIDDLEMMEPGHSSYGS